MLIMVVIAGSIGSVLVALFLFDKGFFFCSWVLFWFEGDWIFAWFVRRSCISMGSNGVVHWLSFDPF